MKTAQELQKEIDELRAEMDRRTADFKSEIDQKNTHISNLEAQIFDLKKYRFGSSSEKNPNQLPLFNEAESITDTKVKVKKTKAKKKGGTRKPLPASLEREEQIHDLADEQKTCQRSHKNVPKSLI